VRGKLKVTSKIPGYEQEHWNILRINPAVAGLNITQRLDFPGTQLGVKLNSHLWTDTTYAPTKFFIVPRINYLFCKCLTLVWKKRNPFPGNPVRKIDCGVQKGGRATSMRPPKQ
jgi:hypothetical protein